MGINFSFARSMSWLKQPFFHYYSQQTIRTHPSLVSVGCIQRAFYKWKKFQKHKGQGILADSSFPPVQHSHNEILRNTGSGWVSGTGKNQPPVAQLEVFPLAEDSLDIAL